MKPDPIRIKTPDGGMIIEGFDGKLWKLSKHAVDMAEGNVEEKSDDPLHRHRMMKYFGDPIISPFPHL